jgi:fructosamine-3-kinase
MPDRVAEASSPSSLEHQPMLAPDQATRFKIERGLNAIGRADGLVGIVAMSGGAVAQTWRLTYANGSHLVAKTMTDVPGGLFGVEASGLAALRATGCVRTPEVLADYEDLLLLESLQPAEDNPRYWESLATDLGALHASTVHGQFGWHHDGYLGRLAQRNDWTAGGHQFFAEHRLLRYLAEPMTQRVMAQRDQCALERLCDRLPSLVPDMPPVLTHGDLWSGNLLTAPDGRPVLIDPAVSFGWAEVDLSMMWCERRPAGSNRFFDRYRELQPLAPGWKTRMPILHLRELLCVVAHVGNAWGTADLVSQVLAPFRAN